jgi:hypothetical protein
MPSAAQLRLSGCLMLGMIVLAVAPVGGAEGTVKPLKAALEKTTPGLDAYAFEISNGPGKGPGNRVTGKFQKGHPLFCEANGIDFFREGDKLVYRQGEKWTRTRTGRVSDPLRILVASAAVQRVQPPHQELPTVLDGLSKVKKTDEKGGSVYSGDLDAKTARKLAPADVREITQGGSAQVWIDKGRIVKYRYTLQVKGRLGNAEANGTRTKTVELKGLGKTKVEVPAAAQKALKG